MRGISSFEGNVQGLVVRFGFVNLTLISPVQLLSNKLVRGVK